MTYRRLRRITYLGLILLDFIGVLLAFLFAYLLRSSIPSENYYLPQYEYSILSIILGVFYVLILHSAGTQKNHPFSHWQVEVWTVSSGLVKGTILFMAIAFLYREFSISRMIVILHLILAVIILAVLRLLWRLIVINPAFSSGAKKRILALTRNDTNGSIASNEELSQDLITHTWLDNQNQNDLEKLIIDKSIDGIELTEKEFPPEMLLDIALTSSKMGIDLQVKPDLVGLLPLNFTLQEIDGKLYWTAGRGLRELYPRTMKRVIDLILGIIFFLIVFIPGLIISLIILFTSPGGIFYRHKRIGRKGRKFNVLKFRTMYRDADERLKKDPKLFDEFQKGYKLKNDPRITPIGNFLRKTSLDELPQVINILLGQMSFVGPRPVVESELDRYGRLKNLLMSVPPGLTGLWQVSGRSDLSYEERVRLDLYYVENWSLARDAQILARTLPAILFSRGAY